MIKKGIYILFICVGMLLMCGCGKETSSAESVEVQKTEQQDPLIQEQQDQTAQEKTDQGDGKSQTENPSRQQQIADNREIQSTASEEENQKMKMQVQVNDQIFTASLENNSAVDALVKRMQEEPVVISMSDYAGFEKVGGLGMDLPTEDIQTTTRSGDIVLYNGNQIVIFYGSNSWSYTRLGRIDDLSGWKEALGSGDVTVTFSVE